MTPQEIIKKGKAVVRQSGTLYPIYIDLFETAFGRAPECPTCGSAQGNKDWADFKAYAEGLDPGIIINHNISKMAKNSSFKIKNRIKIYKYVGEDGRVKRVYGDVMSDSFAIDYLKNAENDLDLLGKRKAEFSILPEQFRDEVKAEDKGSEDGDEAQELPKTLKGLKELAEQKGYPEDEWSDIKTIADMKLYVETQLSVEGL